MPSRADLNSLFDTYKSSVLNKDVDALMAIYEPDAVAFDMWGVWSHVGDKAWREVNQKWLGSLGSATVVVEFDDISIIQSDDVSAAYATVTYKSLSDTGDILRSMQNRLTWVTKRTDGMWRIVHQHTSAPIDPDTMKPKLRR
jgi:uncharacterized protein (TIGR02246 family)